MSRANRKTERSFESVVIDRRVFVGAVGAACGVSLLPLPSLAALAPASGPALLADWTIDDMWGVYPRYADPIGYGRLPAESVVAADPVDAGFVS